MGIAAALQGAAEVSASDIDRNARAAVRENAALNGVRVGTLSADLLDGPVPVPGIGVILAGDIFYEETLAARALGFLRRAHDEGILVLLADIGRSTFPRDGLRRVACYEVTDVGDTETTPPHQGGVHVMADRGSVGDRLD